MSFYSPLRYPGGKGKISDYFKQVVKENLLYDGIYVEPYAGSASVGLSLLFNEYVSKIIINDIDRSIFALWYSVLHRTDELCELIERIPVNLKTWEIQKKNQLGKEKCDLLKLGFSTFFLNRTNRSGILTAGCIGGQKQEGKWKIDARYNKEKLIRRIRLIEQFKNRIELHNLDAIKLIKKINKKPNQKSLFYFDPPYYCKGRGLYLNHYNHNDHKKIAQEIMKLKESRWIITYDNVESIKKLYDKYRQIQFNLNYSAGKASKGEEVMIFSDNIYIPNRCLITN